MLCLKNISKSFTNEEATLNIFNNLNLNFNEGETTSIIGPNGCGKSTLFNLITGNLKVDSGEIFLENKRISDLEEEKRAKFFGRVFQDPTLGTSPNLTILENLKLAELKCQKPTLKILNKKKDRKKYIELLEEMDLDFEKLLDNKVKNLSGGQRQSLALVMVLLNEPKLLLLDEHTAALDPKAERLVMENTKRLVKKLNITTIMISHNLEYALKYSDRVVMLKDGKVALDEKSENISLDDLIKEYEDILNFP